MHVALYLKHFPPRGAPLRGGTAIAVDGLASGLSQAGAQVTVLCEGSGRSAQRTAAGYAIECFPGRGPYRSFTVSPELQRYTERQLASRRSVCLVNGMFHPSVYAMARVLRRQGVPYVAVPHDPYDRAVFGRNSHLKWPYWYLFERRLLRSARAVQVLDARHGACLERLGVKTPLIEAPNGVRPELAPAEPRLNWGDPSGTARLVFLGRMDAYNKGLDALLDGFARASAGLDLKLAVQGPDWGDRPRLERSAYALGIAHKVAFHAPDYVRTGPEIIGEHDLFCLPSRFEGFGLAALEAMLAARVLLVSEGAGILRHVLASGCGVAVQPTAAGVELGLRSLLKRRAEWREMGLAGRRYALANLKWTDVAAAALRQYERLAA